MENRQNPVALPNFSRKRSDRFLAVWTDDTVPVLAGPPPTYKRRVVSSALKLHCQKKGVRLMDAALVYFIREPLKGAVKIGISWDIPARLITLQSAHPYELKLLGHCPGGQTLESDLHEVFAEDRLSGEWFTYSPNLRTAITALCSPDKAGKWRDYTRVRRIALKAA